MSFELKWNANISTIITKLEEGQSLPIQGELLDSSINKNKWAVQEDELPKIASQVKKGVQLRVDHSSSVRDIIGATNDGMFDSATSKVNFGAEIDDPSIAMGVMKGRLKYVSIGASADPYCSKCETPFKMFRECSCKGGHTIIKNVKIKEVSIVSDPAYSNSKFNPVSFVASVNEALAKCENNEKEEKYMVEVKAESFSAEEIKEFAKEVLTTEMTKMATDMFGPVKQEVSDISESLKVILNERKEELSKKEIEKREADAKAKEAEMVKSIVKTVMEEIAKAEKPVEKKLTPEEEQKMKDEEEAKKKKEEETIVEGAKVEDADGTDGVPITAQLSDVWAELRTAAKKYEII